MIDAQFFRPLSATSGARERQRRAYSRALAAQLALSSIAD